MNRQIQIDELSQILKTNNIEHTSHSIQSFMLCIGEDVREEGNKTIYFSLDENNSWDVYYMQCDNFTEPQLVKQERIEHNDVINDSSLIKRINDFIA
jgi:hypothetical protein